jgi:hypothetical protein
MHINKLKKLINGPLNVIRLVNKKTNKIIYLYGDWHKDVEQQSMCDDIFAKDIKDIFVEQFSKFNKNKAKLDFFFEINPSEITQSNNYSFYKLKYIHETVKLFQKSFNFDFKNNKNNESKLFPNVRLHYIDIRDILFKNTFDVLYNLSSLITEMRNYNYEKYYSEDIIKIKDGLTIIAAQVKSILDSFLKDNYIKINTKFIKHNTKFIIPENINALSKYTQEDLNNNANNIIHKIKSKYNNNNIKTKMQFIINNYLIKYLNLFLNNVTNFVNYLNEPNVKILGEFSSDKLYIKDQETNYGLPPDVINSTKLNIQTLFEKNIFLSHFDINVLLVDLFFLRRMLDKDYVSNIICYTGIMHTCNYIYFLVKYFDFEITHTSYLKKEYHISNINEKIFKLNNPRYVDTLIFPETFRQCSDVSSFPQDDFD